MSSVGEEQDYAIAGILAVGVPEPDGIKRFLVRWEGYEEPTWEPASALNNCKKMLEGFCSNIGQYCMRKSGIKKQKPTSGRKVAKSQKKVGRKAAQKAAAAVSEMESEDEEEYEVDKILDVKEYRGVKKYLVSWVGYGRSDATWQPLEDLQNSQKKIDEFENSRKKDNQEKQATGRANRAKRRKWNAPLNGC